MTRVGGRGDVDSALVDSETLFDWLALIDYLDYYQLFQVERGASYDEIKEAFHAFAHAFHPDGHPGRSADERVALDRIFKRGTEAYVVLADERLRAEYDQKLVVSSPAELPRIVTSGAKSEKPMSNKLEDRVRTPNARPFARRAEELFEKGEYQQAKLQLTMARHMDANNPALEGFMKQVEAKLKVAKKA
jgi:DnaJ-class molecular chaperone